MLLSSSPLNFFAALIMNKHYKDLEFKPKLAHTLCAACFCVNVCKDEVKRSRRASYGMRFSLKILWFVWMYFHLFRTTFFFQLKRKKATKIKQTANGDCRLWGISHQSGLVSAPYSSAIWDQELGAGCGSFCRVPWQPTSFICWEGEERWCWFLAPVCQSPSGTYMERNGGTQIVCWEPLSMILMFLGMLLAQRGKKSPYFSPLLSRLISIS